MALSNDQRALLRLLAQREEGYGDIGALLGVGVDEVRSRVREALAELEANGRAAAPSKATQSVPPPPPPPAPSNPAPVPRPEPSRAPSRPPASFAAMAGTALRHLPRPRTRRGLYELLGGIVVVVLLVLFATGAVDIGGGGSKSGTSGKTPVPSELPSGTKVKPTAAVLSPVDGGSASGRALFGRSKETVLLLVEARGLSPSAKGQSYAISLARSATERVPVAATEVGKSGTIAGQYQIAPEALGLLASGYDQMEIALVSNAALKAALTKAKQERKPLSYVGTPVLRGSVTGPFIKKK